MIPAISVTGYLPDIREAVGRATVAVCPVTVKVGIQNKVLEAMAMGVPVVCTETGLEGPRAKPGRDAQVAESPGEFADHVSRLLADAELRDCIGKAGRHYVETNHRWDIAAQQVETEYFEAVGYHGRIAGALPPLDMPAVYPHSPAEAPALPGATDTWAE